MEAQQQPEQAPANAPFNYPQNANRVWRERALTRATELWMLLEWFQSQDSVEENNHDKLDRGIRRHLNAAVDAASIYSPFRPWPNGALIERVMSHLDAAEVALLRRAPITFFAGMFDYSVAHVRRHLGKDDPRRLRLELLSLMSTDGDMGAREREAAVQALAAANSNARAEFIRVSNYRTIIVIIAAVLFVVAAIIGVWGFVAPEAWSICFSPVNVNICPLGTMPTPADVILVQFIGVLGAAISGSSTLSRLNAATTPLGLPVVVTLLKLPTGALTAILGLMLVRGDFVPGVSNLDSSAQILAYAAIFGSAQQLITRTIDRQADQMLNQTAA